MVGSAVFSEEQCIHFPSRVEVWGSSIVVGGSPLVCQHQGFAVLQVRSQYSYDSFTTLLCLCRMLQTAFVSSEVFAKPVCLKIESRVLVQ